MKIRFLGAGFAIWLGATVALRLGGQFVLRPHNPAGTTVLFAVSFPSMASLVRRLCSQARLPQEQWLAGAASIAFPSLVLDTFSSAFFPIVYPNMAPDLAGVFGGWILWCCAGAFAGAAISGARRS
jgi:uncharacterized protein DUF5367